MSYQSEYCFVDHQNGPDQDYWYISDPRNGYDPPSWPTYQAMMDDLASILSTWRPSCPPAGSHE